MPSCPHCVHNWLFMNYLYSDGKNCNSHLCSHALTVFENRISHNLFVISYISFFYKLFRFNMKIAVNGNIIKIALYIFELQ